MVVAMILRENRIEIAAYKSHLASSFVKRLSLDVGESFIKNGKIVSSHFLGKLIAAEMKKNQILPGELVIAVRSNEILTEKIYLSDYGKTPVLQRGNEVLEANQPGILNNNDIICKKYDEQDGRVCLNVAIVPKLLTAQHRALAEAMKCRLVKLISYTDCVAKLGLKDCEKLTDDQILVDIGEDFIRFYQLKGGEIQRVDDFITRQIPLHSPGKKIKTELIDKIYRSILPDGEKKQPQEQLNEEGSLQYVFLQEVIPDLDKSFLDSLILNRKKEDSLLTAAAGQKGNVKKTNIRHGILLSGTGAFGVFLILLFVALFGNNSAGQKPPLNFDYRIIQDSMEKIVAQEGSRLDRVSLNTDRSVKVEAATSAYSNIDTVISKMEEAGLEEVELIQVQLVNGQENPIIYTISAKYTMGMAQPAAAEKTNNHKNR